MSDSGLHSFSMCCAISLSENPLCSAAYEFSSFLFFIKRLQAILQYDYCGTV